MAAPIGIPEAGSQAHADAVRRPGTEDDPDDDVRTSHASRTRTRTKAKASSRADAAVVWNQPARTRASEIPVDFRLDSFVFHENPVRDERHEVIEENRCRRVAEYVRWKDQWARKCGAIRAVSPSIELMNATFDGFGSLASHAAPIEQCSRLVRRFHHGPGRAHCNCAEREA
ncbi:TPA: hypothetical protein ACU967_006821 [Burkholderia contaminans]|uniref:Uncharacterized protein n=1 Tax=Burkholderia contaminans TaxID=488447 RepID=A0AAP4VLZ0_9BURK|nr:MULTISPECIES: hypothetical protein [Burkholderia]MBD1416306.1 hypothetical protein [Burkholderia contaminans]MBH9671989.1 hypothetical protein [Burkholderia contaminans]MBH9679299.1 hypothetical protein [Burkholderia contaminans]MBH9709346.1 hypothetical protein [Burkholderia contaminans]MBM6425724.1 hypothetical protein [Burkholderia contaminans]